MIGSGLRWVQSLRWRLLWVTVVAILVAVMLAGVLLSGLFRDHVLRQFAAALTSQLDQVTARLEFDPAGEPQLDPGALTDPRWSRPYSGLYWQLDSEAATARRGVLRSRSLWDTALVVPTDVPDDGKVHVHETTGPEGARLLLVERIVRRADPSGTPWRLLVAADMQETDAAVTRFNGVLAASLAALFALLCIAALAQVAMGLAPLRALQRALTDVHEGRAARLEGRFPEEVQPLIDAFNGVLDRNAEVVARARTQAGNLAHAIKTPLAAMAQAAAAARQDRNAAVELAPLVQEQVEMARRQVDWHLARSRAAAAHGLPGARVAVRPVIDGLLRVLERVHVERGLTIRVGPIAPGLSFAGEAQDLQEILGNVLDNACKWARREVQIEAVASDDERGAALRIVIDDDGPGVEPGRREAVVARGARLDESVPGSGLGLAIVQELVGLYGGSVELTDRPSGGLRITLTLPRSA